MFTAPSKTAALGGCTIYTLTNRDRVPIQEKHTFSLIINIFVKRFNKTVYSHSSWQSVLTVKVGFVAACPFLVDGFIEHFIFKIKHMWVTPT